jgi:alkanesulfonate monooxygenase SsuD/methylene tetrahydromethanopterin reductase-like flavin-dependent oxidoreductase (luciferase family)
MQRIRFGWHMPSFPVDGSSGVQFIDQMEQTLERIQGVLDSAWADDHFIPWATWQSPDTPYLECISTMAYWAAAYPRLRFGSTVFCQGYRNPALLAKTAANMQLLMRGRLLFGIGAGWMEREYYQYGYAFPSAGVRLAQLEEAVQIVKLLWTQPTATFHGKYYHIQDAYLEPKPDPVPPILIGGGGEQRTLRIVAQYADWWNYSGGTVETYAHKLDVLKRHCAAVGRDPATILLTWSTDGIAVAPTEAEARRIAEASPYSTNPVVGTPAQVVEQLQQFVDLGISYFIARMLDFPRPDGMELFMQEVVPHFRE